MEYGQIEEVGKISIYLALDSKSRCLWYFVMFYCRALKQRCIRSEPFAQRGALTRDDYFLVCIEIKSSEWDTGPFARQVIEGVGLAHTLDILSSEWDTGTFRSTVYWVDGAQTQSLSTSSSNWACVPFAQHFIE